MRRLFSIFIFSLITMLNMLVHMAMHDFISFTIEIYLDHLFPLVLMHWMKCGNQSISVIVSLCKYFTEIPWNLLQFLHVSRWKHCTKCFFFSGFGLQIMWNQGPVVQSAVSLTSSLRVISLTVLADSIYNILIFFAEKMWVAFALQKLLTFFQQKISAYLRITWCKF